MEIKRILLKLSGEALAGEKHTGFDQTTVDDVARQIAEVVKKGIQVSVVIGGGNFWRGRTSEAMDRVKADQIGMLATVMNAIFTSDAVRRAGVKTHVMTPFAVGAMTEPFNRDKAIEYLEAGEVCFFAGGTGHPYFSTDTATVLRAVETQSDAMLFAKAIDGVYDSDPNVNPDAKKYDKISYKQIIENKLGVIDLASAVLAEENKMPMLLFGLSGENSIVNALTGTFTGTEVTVE